MSGGELAGWVEGGWGYAGRWLGAQLLLRRERWDAAAWAVLKLEKEIHWGMRPVADSGLISLLRGASAAAGELLAADAH